MTGLWGYQPDDKVQVKVRDRWLVAVVRGTDRHRGIRVTVLGGQLDHQHAEQASFSVTVDNPTRVRKLTPEALQAYLTGG